MNFLLNLVDAVNLLNFGSNAKQCTKLCGLSSGEGAHNLEI